MADIKLTKDCYVPKENINFYVAYESNAVKSDVRKKRRDQLVFDYTNGKKILSVCFRYSSCVGRWKNNAWASTGNRNTNGC